MIEQPLDASGWAYVIEIQKALTTIRFTAHGSAITVGTTEYPPAPGADVTGIQFPGNASAFNADVVIATVIGGLLEPGDGVRGMLDDWPIKVGLVDPNNTDNGIFWQIDGTIGSVEEDSNGVAIIAANGPLRLAQEKPMCRHFGLLCDHVLGDDGCKVPLLAAHPGAAFDIGRSQDFVTVDTADGLQRVADAYARVRVGSGDEVEDYDNVYLQCTVAGTTAATAPDYSGITEGDTVVDGTASFLVQNAWTRHVRGEAVDEYHIQFDYLPDPRASEATWYVDGGLFIRSGPLADFPEVVILEWDPDTLTARTALPISVTDIPADTQMEIHPGCDLTSVQCNTRFSNIVNIFSFEFVPPPEFIF